MTEKIKIEVPLDKSKLTKLLFFCILFLIGGLWLIISNPQTSNPVFNNFFIKSIGAYGSVLMGLWGIWFFTKKIFDKKPGLVIDEEGICDNTSAFNFGLIPWIDISHIHERTVQASITSKQRFITIGLVNPDKYILKETNVLKRRLLKVNAKSFGSPIHISTNGLKTNHNDLLKLITEYFENTKTSPDKSYGQHSA